MLRLHHRHRNLTPRTGFSLTELLVVIGIIVLLVGLLLVALGQVKKKADRTRTQSLMQQFANACMSFHTEHGMYPGVIPDEVLVAHEAANGSSPISATENALLHLMGGYRVLPPNTPTDSLTRKEYDNYPGTVIHVFNSGTPNEWRLKVNVQRIGEGPFINGKPYAPYFTPSDDSLAVIGEGFDAGGAQVPGQIGQTNNVADRFPDLVDSWGQPILYIRQSRPRGPLVYDDGNATARPQFGGNQGGAPLIPGINCFLASQGTGEKNANQDEWSIFGSTVGASPQLKAQLWAVILGHQTFYKTNDPLNGQARSGLLLISAGPDAIYFSRTDGPGSPANPLDSGTLNSDIIQVGPRILEDSTDGFDDLREYGGG